MRANVVSRVGAAIALVMLWVPVAQAGHAGGGSPPPISTNAFSLLCRAIDGAEVNQTATVGDIYGESQVRIGTGRLVCTIAAKVDPAPPNAVSPFTGFTCYNLSTIAGQGAPEPNSASLADSFESTNDVTVSAPRYLCVPTVVPDVLP